MPIVTTGVKRNVSSSIRTATARDLRFIDHLQRKFSNNLGFLPWQALVESIDAGHCTLVFENEEPAGYVVTRQRLRSQKWCRPITQAAVCTDAQRQCLGLSLIDHVARVAFADLLEGMQLWIAEELQEVRFFEAAGFVVIGSREPMNARQRKLLCMRRSLQPFRSREFLTMPTVAGCVPKRIVKSSS